MDAEKRYRFGFPICEILIFTNILLYQILKLEKLLKKI